MNKTYLLSAVLLTGCLSEDHTSIEGHTLDEARRSLASKSHDEDPGAPEGDPAGEFVAAFHEPLRAAVDASLGRTSADVVRGANAARVTLAVECLHMSGYSPAVSDIEAIIVVDHLATTTVLDVSIETVTTGQTDVDRLGIPEEHLASCIGDAESRLNPEFALAQLIEPASLEISKVLSRDPRLLAALEEESSCLADVGLRDDIEQFSEEEFTASEITAAFLTGDIDQEDALAELEELETQRATRAPKTHAVGRCVGQRLAIERTLVAEQQRAYLEAHPKWADDVAATYREALTALTL